MRIASFGAGLLLLCSVTCAAFASTGSAVPLETKGADAKESKTKKPPTDAQLKQILIDESIAAYSGNCPCPYNTARNGSRCGRLIDVNYSCT